MPLQKSDKYMNLTINIFELANVLIVISLLFIIIRRRDVTTLLLILFVYGTLHFGFSAIALIDPESASLLIRQHPDGGGVLAKSAVLLLLGVVFVLLSRHAYRAYLLSQGREKKITLYCLLVMGALFCGYILNIRDGDWVQLKNVISLEVMLAFLLTGYLGAIGAFTLNVAKTYSWSLGGLFILCITVCIAVYEVLSCRSWAGTLESSGAMVYRASSVLFNPNLFGFWASLIYLGCAYGMHSRKEFRRLMLCGMVLASIDIYLSGSRSMGYLLLGVVFISTALLKERLRWVALMTLPVTMLTIYASAALLVAPFVSSNKGGHELTLLGERFIAAPLHLINYIWMLIDIPSEVTAGIPSEVTAGIPSEVIVAIEGRFKGGGSDSGWYTLYQNVGWLGLVAVILASCMLAVWAIRAYITHPNPSSVYALAILHYCLFAGFVMRFQIFPVWLFISTILIPCLVFWRQLALPTLRIRS